MAKVTGTAEYIYNLELSGMLHGKIVRSTAPHGRIRRIATEAASDIQGVHAVITGADVLALVPDPYYGPAFHDQPILALEKVRFVGEPIAVVLADDPRVGEVARDLVQVEYEALPSVFDERAAAETDAPVLHEELRPSSAFKDLQHLVGRSGTNVAMEYRLRRGDVERGFAESDLVVEDVYRTQQVMHAPLEPHVTLVEMGGSSSLIVHSSTQSPSFVRSELARLLGWPEERVRVRTAFLGGGFGAKLYTKLEPLAMCCALISGRPVKIALSMEEQFFMITRHGTTFRIKTGVSRDGRIIARKCDIWWNGGAYADIGPRVTQKAGYVAAGPYDIEHVSVDSYAVYTNLPPAGAMRGFGVPQVNWAHESHTDDLAFRLGMDPVDFRFRNLLRQGRPHATGTPMRHVGTDEVLTEVAERMHWSQPFDRGDRPQRRGRGIAIAIKAVVTPSRSVAEVHLSDDGGCAVACSTVDMGQGSDTAMAQIAADVLCIDAEAVRVLHPDTDVTPYDMGTLGSRSTFHMGNAVVDAAKDVGRQVIEIAAELLGAPASELELYDGNVLYRRGEKKISFQELMKRRSGRNAGPLVGTGVCSPPYEAPDATTGLSANVAAFWMVGACGVEIEVDEETGRIRVGRLVSVGDVGKAINPGLVAGQLSGGAIQQLGMALSEEMQFEDGQLINAGLAYYKVPITLDVPTTIETALVEIAHDDGPFGAKGVGETGSLAVAAAVGNAVFDAVGVRIRDLPLTPERVLGAIRAREPAAPEGA